MFQELSNPQLLLALAKITAILLVTFALSPLIKRSSLRASLWTASILALPFVFAFSFSTSFIALIPPQQSPITKAPEKAEMSALPLAQEIIPATTTELLPLSPQPANTVEITPEKPSPAQTTLPSPSDKSLPWLRMIYFTGVFLAFTPWLLSLLKLSFLKKSPATGKPHELWQSLISHIPVKAEIKFTPSPSAPFTSGILKPSVLIPHDSTDWSHRRLQATLLHEVAHLQRRDPLTRFLSSLVKALFWFHPLVWLAHRQLISAQEQACDQYALTHGLEPEDYAEDLLHSASHSHTTPSEALAMARWSQLGNRIRHILNVKNHRPTTMKQITTLCGIFLVAAFAITTIGFAIEPTSETKSTHATLKLISVNDQTARISLPSKSDPKALTKLVDDLFQFKVTQFIFLSPETGEIIGEISTAGPHESAMIYLAPNIEINIIPALTQQLAKQNIETVTFASEPTIVSHPKLKKATAVVQIHPSMIALNPFGKNQMGALMTRNYMANEFAIITSSENLFAAAKTLKLDFKSIEQAVLYLKKHVTTKSRRGTDFIEISAFHKEQAKAVDIANAIVDSYISRRNAMELNRAMSALETLDDELQKQGDLVKDRRKALTVLIQEYGIPYSNLTGNPTGMTEEKILISARRKIEELEDHSAQLKIQIDKLLSTSQEDLVRIAASLKLADNRVAFYYTQYREAKDSVSALEAQGLGARHPRVQTLHSKARKALSNAGKEVVTLKEALKSRQKLVTARMKRIREMVTPNLNNTVDLSMQQHTYSQAQTEYETAREMFRQMKIKQQEARVLLNMPRNPITMHEKAR